MNYQGNDEWLEENINAIIDVYEVNVDVEVNDSIELKVSPIDEDNYDKDELLEATKRVGEIFGMYFYGETKLKRIDDDDMFDGLKKMNNFLN